MGFIDWITGTVSKARQAAAWAHGNIIKPTLGAAHKFKGSFWGGALARAADLPFIGTGARIASDVVNKLSDAHEWLQTPQGQTIVDTVTGGGGAPPGPGPPAKRARLD